MKKIITVRDIDAEAWHKFRASAVESGNRVSDRLNMALGFFNALGFPRQAHLDGVEYRLIPHRILDGSDDESGWFWEIQIQKSGVVIDSWLI